MPISGISMIYWELPESDIVFPMLRATFVTSDPDKFLPKTTNQRPPSLHWTVVPPPTE